MALTFLSLVNNCCHRLNETPLTEVAFNNATGEYQNIKDAVNYALQDVEKDAYTWPHNHMEQEVTLDVGRCRYPLPDNYKIIVGGSFRILRSDTFNNPTRYLPVTGYRRYITTNRWIDEEARADAGETGELGRHRGVFLSPDGKQFGVFNDIPDHRYELVYEYYKIPPPLDICRAPAGALQISMGNYKQGLNQLRELAINRNDVAISTVVDNRINIGNVGPRVGFFDGSF